MRTLIKNLQEEENTTISGWVKKLRNTKYMIFVILSDRSGTIQVSIDKENNVDFIGFSNLHGRIEKQVSSMSTSTCKQINYWEKKIPQILNNK